MISLGIDLSSMPAGTALCALRWEPHRVAVHRLQVACDDATLDAGIAEAIASPHHAVGIDAPLGWPAPFAAAIDNWTEPRWNPDVRDRLRYRRTDLWLREHFGLQPLSVSSDLIALPAMRAMALLHRHGVTDRSGTKGAPFFEVYPAGALARWGLPSRGYKKASDPQPRRQLLDRIQHHLPALDLGTRTAFVESADALDALIAALATRAAWQGFSHRPPAEHQTLAETEGWIHLPTRWPSL